METVIWEYMIDMNDTDEMRLAKHEAYRRANVKKWHRFTVNASEEEKAEYRSDKAKLMREHRDRIRAAGPEAVEEARDRQREYYNTYMEKHREERREYMRQYKRMLRAKKKAEREAKK